MLIPHHLECEICGAKSVSVQDRFQLTEKERQALTEFTAEHVRCAEGLEGFSPEHAVAGRPDGWVCPTQGGAFGSPKADPRSVPVPHGHFEYTGPYGEIQSGDTISCCHCRRHTEMRAGVERRLGFCALCYNGTPGSGSTCGRPCCETHLPYVERLANLEAGRPADTPMPPKVPSGFGGAVLLSPLEAEHGFVEAS